MKVNSNIKKYIKNMTGTVIGVGIDNKEIIEIIDKNNKILVCDLLNSIDINGTSSGKKTKKKKFVKKLRKKYKKKKVNYIIVNSNEINRYLKTFVRDSIYINNTEIYYYMDKTYNIEKIIKKYKRYDTEIEIIKCEDGNILRINTSKAKNNFFKDKFYFIVDTLSNIADIIGDILVS